MSLHGNPRILIVRLSAIGDVIHGLPVLTALRTALPTAFLAWVVEGKGGELLRGHSALDELVVAPRRWLRSPSATWALRRELRALRCQITIDLQGLTKSAIAAKLSGARRRIGFDGVDGREFSTWLNNERIVPTATHVIDRNLELLKNVIDAPRNPGRQATIEHGDTPHDWAPITFQLPEVASDALMAEGMLSRHGLRSGYAVLNPGAGWPSKLWPPSRFAEVARHLGQRWSLPSVVVWAGEQERYWAAQIVSEASGHAVLAPTTSLTELASILRRARIFVGSDTGPLHLAVAVETPSVGLFGPMPATRNGPYGPRHVAVQQMELTGSSRSRRSAGPESMQAIGVEDVTQACDVILGRGAQQRQAA